MSAHESLEIRVKGESSEQYVDLPWEGSISLDEYWFRMLRPALLALRRVRNEGQE